MYHVVDTATGRVAATVSFGPYQYHTTNSAERGLELALEDAEGIDQMNRTPGGTVEMPEEPGRVGNRSTSPETYQDPTPTFRRHHLENRIRPRYVFRPTDAAGITAAADVEEGDKVLVDGERGVVAEVRTDGSFEGPDGEEYDPSGEEPVYIVATESGAVVSDGSDLTAEDWTTDQDDPKGQLADHVVDAEASDPSTDDDVTLEAGPTDWDYPESWEESDVPARLILLDAWSSMGGQFDCESGTCCKGTMMSSGMSDRASDQFCASMKDRVLMWEGWRQGG